MSLDTSDFYENPERAIYICGEIGEGLVDQLISEILCLKGSSAKPITVYLNSLGGSTFYAAQLWQLLRNINQKGLSHKIITVVPTYAASAAADILASGDYAIAYKNSVIHYHGTRRQVRDLTFENASELLEALSKANEQFAFRLAKTAFRRMVFIYGNLESEFKEYRAILAEEKKIAQKDVANTDCLAFALFQKLSHENRNIPRKAYFGQDEVKKLMRLIFEEIGDISKLSVQEVEMEALQIIIRKQDSLLSEDETFSSGGMQEIQKNFESFLDYCSPKHLDEIERLTLKFGPQLLSKAKFKEYLKISEEDKQKDYLEEHAEPLIRELWYFVISLSRQLQHGENRLTAQDAYWLGIVDEVVGVELPSLRLVYENPNI